MGRRGRNVFVVMIVFALGISFLAPGAFAARKTGKIAYVDLSQTFDQYKKTKQFDDVLAGVQTEKEKVLEEMADEIAAMEDKMSLLSEKEKAAKQEEVEEKNKKLRQMSQQIALDLRKSRDEKLKEILEDIEKAIQAHAKKYNYEFVLNDRVLLYGAADADITQDIIDGLNKGYKGK